MKIRNYNPIFPISLILCLVLTFLPLISAFSADQTMFTESQKTDLYWVSYQGSNKTGGCCPILLMQIDQFGNIVRPSKVVIPQGKIGIPNRSGTAIMGLDQQNLEIWAAHRQTDILRAKINKETLITISVKKTLVKTSNGSRIQVTQRKEKNFLTISTATIDGDVLSAFGLQDGLFDGTRWHLSPEFLGDQGQCFSLSGCGGGVSSDGQTAFYVLDPTGPKTDLAVQPLGPRGRIHGDAAIVGTTKGGHGIRAADVTNILVEGKKFVVYVAARYLGPHNDLPDKLFLQIIDAKTGHPLGDRIDLRTIAGAAVGQSVAIDPLGRFVVFTHFNPTTLSNEMSYQALDGTGHASGPLKLLDANGFSGIDILKD